MTLRNATKDFRPRVRTNKNRVRTVGLRAAALYAIPCMISCDDEIFRHVMHDETFHVMTQEVT